MTLYRGKLMTIDSEISEIEETIPEKRVWGFWATAGFGAIILVISFIIQSLVSVIVILVKTLPELDLTPGMLDYEELFIIAEEAMTSYLGLITALSVSIGAVLGVGLILLFIKAKRKAGIMEYLCLGPFGVKGALVALAVTAGFIAVTVTVSILLDRPEPEITFEIYETSVWPALLWISIVILGPIFEEALFRGFLFEGLRQSRVGAVGAIVITSVVFASLHIQYDIYSMGQILLLAIILGIVRLKTNSLWGPMLIHSLNNLLAMILVELTANGTLS